MADEPCNGCRGQGRQDLGRSTNIPDFPMPNDRWLPATRPNLLARLATHIPHPIFKVAEPPRLPRRGVHRVFDKAPSRMNQSMIIGTLKLASRRNTLVSRLM